MSPEKCGFHFFYNYWLRRGGGRGVVQEFSASHYFNGRIFFPQNLQIFFSDPFSYCVLHFTNYNGFQSQIRQ